MTVIDRTYIVTIDDRSLRERKMKLLKQLLNPATLVHNMCNNLVLSLSTRTRYHILNF